MSVTLTSDSEDPVRIKISQTTKGHHYWEVTIRAEQALEARTLLNDTVALAKEVCVGLNLQIAKEGVSKE